MKLTLNEVEAKFKNAARGDFITEAAALRAIAWAIFYLAHVLRYKLTRG